VFAEGLFKRKLLRACILYTWNDICIW